MEDLNNIKSEIIQIETQLNSNTNTIETKNHHIQNKGTGAGGSNTNKTGLSYEELTDLKNEFDIEINGTSYQKIKFKLNYEKSFITFPKKSGLYKLLDKEINKSIDIGHGCKQPDECYLDLNNKNIFILEKKFQQCGGSVCEKLQTAVFKKDNYSDIFPTYNVVYIYCLSDWFKENCKAELKYLQKNNIPIFWGNDVNYKNNIINFIINYS